MKVCFSGLVGLMLVLTAEARIGNSAELKFCSETEQCLLFNLTCATDEYEVRHYGSVKLVTTEDSSWIMEIAAMRAFRRLFKYIGGANAKGEKIAMTAPVIMKMEEVVKNFWESKVYTMSFILPVEHQKDPPKPTDEKVTIQEMPNMNVYVRSFGGWLTGTSDRDNAKTLFSALKRVDAKFKKDFHFAAGYDSPMKLFNRHNEVWYLAEVENLVESLTDLLTGEECQMDQPGYEIQQTQGVLLHPSSSQDDLFGLESSSTSQELKTEPDCRPELEESCPICGDKVSGYHYGLLTCESCKGFFKRSVQNNKNYTCAEQQSCPMNLSQRKRCPYCRFQKCLAVGMKKEAVRADRMRGGRNKFGPLYRRDRQRKQQIAFRQANTAPYRIKMESSQIHQSTAANDLHLMSNHTSASLPSDAFHSSHMFPSGIEPSGTSVPLDCTMSSDRMLSPPSLPYPGLYSRPFPEYLHDKEEMPLSYSPPSTSYSVRPTLSNLFASRGTSPSSPRSTPSSSISLSLVSTHTPETLSSDTAAPNFLSQLLQGEQDESQLCAKVVASLQREQANRGKHDRLNTFSIMCKMADQTLFGLVEWARNSALFKELKVEDQMVLLQSCWSELLVLDHLCRQVTYGKEGCIYLITGQQIEVSTIISQAGVTLRSLVSRTQDLVSKLKALQFDRHEFVCLKYLVLFNPDVKSVQGHRQVEQIQERVNRALMEHTQQSHPGHSDKFGQLLLRLPEVRSISLQVEEYLYQRHLLGDLPCNSLLTEMLHTKHS
ncbi:uncharacterized protein V6R79_023115 [Siganus canaliculatus]